LWARAYQDRDYHAAIHTNNGTEAQNTVLKYSNLPKRKTLTLSRLLLYLKKIICQMLTVKYKFLNFQQTPHYRSYNDGIPTYLQGRPKHVILHCLDRKGSSKKFIYDDIKD
uniref:Uncharacterized protein n=1 Tax=Amphimedon queenslandica TaxID=400682 RepID=A0A1X7TFT1_AMPQE